MRVSGLTVWVWVVLVGGASCQTLIPPVAQNCSAPRVNLIPVVQNFNLDKYLGKWYEIKWLPEEDPPALDGRSDVQHNPERAQDGKTYNVMQFSRGRPTDPNCVPNLSGFYPSGNAKMEIQRTGGTHPGRAPYWVVHTDYQKVALVYGCLELNRDNSCKTPSSRIYSRSTSIDTTNSNLINAMITKYLCLDPNKYIFSAHQKDCIDCRVRAFQTTPNFDPEKYMGKWFQIKWLPQVHIPKEELYDDFQHRFSKGTGKNLAVSIKGRQTPVDPKCFDKTGTVYPTGENGKMEFEREFNKTHRQRTPYWVISTDYSTYSLVYGCAKMTPSGTCLDQVVETAVFARRNELTRQQETSIDAMIDRLCVDTAKLVRTRQLVDCDAAMSLSSSSLTIMVVVLLSIFHISP